MSGKRAKQFIHEAFKKVVAKYIEGMEKSLQEGYVAFIYNNINIWVW